MAKWSEVFLHLREMAEDSSSPWRFCELLVAYLRLTFALGDKRDYAFRKEMSGLMGEIRLLLGVESHRDQIYLDLQELLETALTLDRPSQGNLLAELACSFDPACRDQTSHTSALAS